MSDFTGPNNPYNPAARDKRALLRQGKKKEQQNRMGKAAFSRYSDARAVACEIMGIKYVPVQAPRNLAQLIAAAPGHPAPLVSAATGKVPESWEMLTERR